MREFQIFGIKVSGLNIIFQLLHRLNRGAFAARASPDTRASLELDRANSAMIFLSLIAQEPSGISHVTNSALRLLIADG
jgi:hypothetical protein